MPLVRRTRAIFRRAEFGFFGVVVETRVQTPRFCGAPASAGVFVFAFLDVRPLRMSWFTVGMLRLMSLWSGVRSGRMHTDGRGSTRLPPNRLAMVPERPRTRHGQPGSKPWPFFRAGSHSVPRVAPLQ